MVEGDSSLVKNMLAKLNNGTKWDKLSQSLRITQLIQEIEEIIYKFDYILVRHVRREGNNADEFLANWGCNHQNNKLEKRCPIQPFDQNFKILREILE